MVENSEGRTNAGAVKPVPRRVLVVEDDDGLNQLALKVLRKAGYDADGVSNGAGAIAHVMAHPGEVLLLDIELPDMAGSELIGALAERGSRVPFVVMTGHGDERTAVEMMKLGASDYLIKRLDLVDRLPDVFRRLFRELDNERRLHAAEEALRENEERFRALFHNAPLSYQSLQADGTVLQVNDTWCETLGYRREEVIGENFADFLAPEFVEHFLYNFPCFKRDGEIHGVEFEMVRKDGRHINVVFEGKIAHNPDGTFRQTHCILQDVTERKRAEEKQRDLELRMQQTQKLESLGVMAGGIAHDFNNILYAILGNAELALGAMPFEAAGREHLQEIQLAARRASELTDQMLAYSGKGALAIEKLDLSGLVREMTHLLEVSHTKKAIVKYRFAEDLPAVAGDPSQLRQIVMNLITNASEAIGEEGGLITVTTGVSEMTQEYLMATYVDQELPGGRYVYLEVEDTGCGMDEETQRRVFEPFFTTKFTGRGLGMAAVLGILRAHKGAIDIQSEVDHGTTVKVLFPALDESAPPPSEATPSEGDWSARGTVLVVDDEAPIRNLVKLVLERKGFAVLTASDGREAMDVFREHKDDISCVLLDLTMPHMGGEETFVAMHRIREDVPVVLLSGYSEEQLKERVEDLGFAGFLKKPVRSRDLLGKVRAVLAVEGGP